MMRPVLLLTMLIFCSGCGDAPPPQNTKMTAIAGSRVTLNFDTPLTGWSVAEGTWALETADQNGVLKQSATDKRFPLALWTEKQYTDVDVSVRFRPVSGNVDASGGIVFRAQDGNNYYLVRANALEDNLRLYIVNNDNREQICSTAVETPKLGQWHTLRVIASNDHIQSYLDGKLLIDFMDSTYKTGYVGLWTKADSVTLFDDLQITGE